MNLIKLKFRVYIKDNTRLKFLNTDYYYKIVEMNKILKIEYYRSASLTILDKMNEKYYRIDMLRIYSNIEKS